MNVKVDHKINKHNLKLETNFH